MRCHEASWGVMVRRPRVEGGPIKSVEGACRGKSRGVRERRDHHHRDVTWRTWQRRQDRIGRRKQHTTTTPSRNGRNVTAAPCPPSGDDDHRGGVECIAVGLVALREAFGPEMDMVRSMTHP